MDDAGWITGIQNVITPKELAEVCLEVQYESPFELIFYCYYAFPTDYPEDIRKIFGREYFENVIEPEAKAEFRQTIQETGVKAVVVFNKGIFNLVSTDPVDRYIDRLIGGEIIQSPVDGADRDVPIFLTFPTGWRYKKDFRQYRKDSLIAIRETNCNLR